jgi:hypothetical protein
MRSIALALVLAWACWWVFFETVEAVGSHRYGQAILFVVVMFGPAAVAWKWPAIGGALFPADGIAATGMLGPAWTRRFDLAQFLLLFIMMPLPLLAAGTLLLLSRKCRPAAA